MATKKPPQTGRLTEIVASRRSQGSSVTGALAGGIKERLKEKFDPRQLINQKGLLTALFPGLKTYQSKTAATEISKSSMQAMSFDEIKPILETISFNTKMTVKNTMVLPALHRDVNVMRQNMVKLVKLKSGDARTKADMYFVKAKDREDKYERELKKERNKQSKIQKLKDEERKKEEDNSKSFFGKIISSIVKGLSSIVSALANLGKAILGVFKFLGNIVGSIILTIVKALMNSLLGINLSDKISDLFKRLVSKNWIKFLFGIISKGIFSFLFSATGLKTLARNMALYLIPIILGREALKSYMERKLQEGEITLEAERKAFRDEEGGQQIPESSISGKALDEYKNLGLVDKNTIALGGGPGRGFKLDQTYAKELVHMFLTEKEATEWGDNRRKYLAVIDRLIKFKEGKIDLSEDKLGNLYDAYAQSRSKLLDLTEKYVKEQYESREQKPVLNAIQVARDRKKEDFLNIMGRNIMEDFIDPVFESVFPTKKPKFIEDIERDAGQVVTGFKQLGNLPETIRNNMSKVPDQIKSLVSEAEKKYIDPLIDKTLDNRRSSVVFKQPIIVNQESVVKKSNPVNQLGSPASAWNNDFIDKYFSDIMMNPTKNIGY